MNMKNLSDKLGNTLYWAICIGSIVFGGILFSVGISLGGASSFKIGSNGLVLYSEFSNYKHGNFEMEELIITENVSTIKINSDLSEINITSGDELSISYYGNVDYKVKNNTLEIDAEVNDFRRFGVYMTTSNTSLIEITVPDYVEVLEIDSSGQITIADLDLSHIDLETALGDVLIEDTFATHVELEANLGNVTLNSCTFDTLKTELNMGALTTRKLDVLTSANIKNNMGAIEIDLLGDENDYNFITSVDMGSLSINGNKAPSFYGLIDILTETSMGSVKITTK